MSDDARGGWFAGLDPSTPLEVAVGRIRGTSAAAGAGDVEAEGVGGDGAATPQPWPRLAVAAGVVADEAAYYDWLHRVTVEAARVAAAEAEGADDAQLIHAIRTLDDLERVENELTERLSDWAGSRGGEHRPGPAGRRELLEAEPRGDDPVETRVRGLAAAIEGLATEADELRAHVERTAPTVAPNLSALAGPTLAARLLALAGGLEDLARMPSGTVQVLGAERALFAHLRGDAPSPKHGVIYVHEAVRGTRPDRRGAAARALAGKLAIAARIDHYAGDRRPSLEHELAERIDHVREGGAES